MKKNFIIPLMLIFTSTVFSQVIDFDYKINFNKKSNTADIKIIVKKGDPAFTYTLHENDFKGRILQSSVPTKKSRYIFRNIPEGKYFIMIKDKFDRPAGITVIIEKDIDQ